MPKTLQLYDVLWRPDPLRYGFGAKLLMEAAFIGIHVAAGAAVLSPAEPPELRPGEPVS